jgi:hypothetical protein
MQLVPSMTGTHYVSIPLVSVKPTIGQSGVMTALVTAVLLHSASSLFAWPVISIIVDIGTRVIHPAQPVKIQP